MVPMVSASDPSTCVTIVAMLFALGHGMKLSAA